MNDERLYLENVALRLRWLMLSRIGIVTFLLAIVTFIELKGMQTLAAISSSALFKALVLAYILSIIYLFLLKTVRNIKLNIYIQGLCDLMLITAIVYATGGIHSLYSVFYPLVIIYSVLFLGRRGGLIIASTAGIVYGLIVELEYYELIYPVNSTFIQGYFPNAGYIFTRIITHFLSFYFITFLMSFVVEQEKKTRLLLAQKQSAFVQLDLLHRSIIESVDTGILTVNMKGRIKSFNRAAAEITGLSFNEVENRMITDIFPDLSREKNSDGDRQTAKVRFETTYPTPDGQNLVLGGSLSPLRDPGGLIIGNIIVFQDLTEINEIRESLEKSRRLAFIGEIAAGMAHEIRNPLASMSGSIQMLSRDLASDETHEKLMKIILRGKDQLENFLKDFLLMARPAPGIREEINLAEMIRDVLESLQFSTDWPESAQTELGLQDNPPLVVQMNRIECRQVLWNVILNAVQAMPEGGTLTVHAYGRRKNGVDGAEIEIRDTGRGIEKSEFKKIFEPFYTTRDTGTGLGLAVVSRILEGYRGKIDIQSEPGKGTACTLWMPCLDLSEEATRIAS
jgi:two-component system sensor histidine kinase PilS (NtrC family)